MKLPADAELERLLEEGDLEGAFFLFGDAERLRDRAARRMIDAAVDPDTRDFNLDSYRGGDVEPEALAAALAMPPMMADRRVVALFDAHDLTPTGRKAVSSALESLPGGLTFLVTATVPDRSKAAFWKTLKKRARTLEWSAPDEQELPGWLMDRARDDHGCELDARAAQALAAAVGADLSLLDAELEKLAAATEGGEVGLETVRSLVARVRAVDRWDWLDRVASRDYGSALADLGRLLAEPSESAVGLLIGMVDQHLYLGLALEGGQKRVADALASAGKPYLKWKARIYARQARAWSGPELERALRLMRRADRHAKSGLGDRRVLEELLLSLRLLREEAA